MSDFLTAMGSLFTFLFTQLTAFATWFTSNVIGQLILGVILFTFIAYLIGFIIQKIKG